MTQTKLRSAQFQKEALYDLQIAPGPLPEITDITTIADVSGSLSGTYFTIDSTTTNYYVWMDVAGVAEITDIQTVADVADSLNETYFLINSPATSYYVWYSNGGGVDPAPGGTAIPVVFTTNDTADTIASLTQTAITGNADFSASVLTDTVTVTNAAVGVTTDATDFDTTFTINTTTQGADDAVDPAPGGTSLAVVLSRDATSNTVATETQGIIDLEADISASVLGSVVTVTNDVNGPVTDAIDSDTGFTVLVTQQGIDGDIYSTGFNFSAPSAGAATLLVFVDGIKQIEGAPYDYVATDPTAVVFTASNIPVALDIVEFYGLA